MRPIRKFLSVAVVLSISSLALAQIPGGALENDDPASTAPTAYVNGPNGPLIFVIGDSISADSTQRDVYAYINGSLGWKTRIEAKGGSVIVNHERWGSFTHARNSTAKAVYVELGTNDIGWINDSLTLAQALVEFDKVFRAVDRAVDALGNKCIVWYGLNEQWDAPVFGSVYDDKDAARAFNDHVKSLLPAHPNLHYADYNQYVHDNATLRDSLLLDSTRIHPQTNDGKAALGQFEAWYSELYC